MLTNISQNLFTYHRNTIKTCKITNPKIIYSYIYLVIVINIISIVYIIPSKFCIKIKENNFWFATHGNIAEAYA